MYICLNLKLGQVFNRYIKLVAGIDGHSVVVQLTEEGNEARISAHIDEDLDTKVLDKHDSTYKKEEIIKMQRRPNGIVDLNDTEMITATPNIYYSL